jgi:hypothetical protein
MSIVRAASHRVILSLALAGMLFLPAQCAVWSEPVRTSTLHPTTTSALSSDIWIPFATNTPLEGFYVATNGTSSGDGSWEHPWDLTTALDPPNPIHPGATIWLRGGTYKGTFVSYLQGTPDAPIVVRQYPGERATIDGNIGVQEAWTTYWGFEVTNSDQSLCQVNGVMAFGAHTKLINLIVHDSRGSGLGIWTESPDSEIYGSIIYNNGTDKFDHGIYVQNKLGTQLISDNVIFNQSGHGIHGYSGPGQYIMGFDIEGNVSFNNGWASQYAANILVGGDTPAERIQLIDNYTYYSDASHLNVNLGYSTTKNKDIVIKNNYFVGGGPVLDFRDWNPVTMTGNTFVGPEYLVTFPLPPAVDISSYQWDYNSYFNTGTIAPFSFRDQDLSMAGWQQITGLDQNSQYVAGHPNGAMVVVRPNRYERGRAHIIVYNWDLQDTVEADVSQVVPLGARYEVRNVQDYFGAPVASGTYDGQPIRLPMEDMQPAPPSGAWVPRQAPTGPVFNVFVLTSSGS